MALVKLGPVSGFPPGSLTEVKIGMDAYAVCNVEGEIHVLDGYCPHRQGPLGHGALHGCMVVCPWHAWEFDCRTGAHDYNPDLKIKKFEVVVQGDEVFIDAGTA